MPLRLALVLVAVLASVADAAGDVLVRWDRDDIPSPHSLGLTTIAIPVKNRAAVRDAIRQGYRVVLEVEPAGIATLELPAPARVAGIVVTGAPSAAQVQQLEKRVAHTGGRVFTVEDRGKWPHVRTNWVTRNNDVLQVTGRSAQPWIENNAALLRMRPADRQQPWLLTYPWKPITLAEADEGPALENYLVAIAEAGSFGGDLLLPLHERFQQRLLAGDPQARREWLEIRRALDFYSWNLPARYTRISNIAVVTAQPAQAFEVLNLLLRHNLPFELLAPAGLPKEKLDGFDLVVALDSLKPAELEAAAAVTGRGGTLVVVQPSGAMPWHGDAPVARTDQRATYRAGSGRAVEVLGPIADPNAFALEVRQLLGGERRVVDIWNGITAITTTYAAPDGKSVLLTAVNYAHEALPVQLRVRGTFSVVQYESPEEAGTLLPHQHRHGYTEFVIPGLRVGGRVFLGN